MTTHDEQNEYRPTFDDLADLPIDELLKRLHPDIDPLSTEGLALRQSLEVDQGRCRELRRLEAERVKRILAFEEANSKKEAEQSKELTGWQIAGRIALGLVAVAGAVAAGLSASQGGGHSGSREDEDGDQGDAPPTEPKYVSGAYRNVWSSAQEDGSCSIERPDGTSIDSSGRIW